MGMGIRGMKIAGAAAGNIGYGGALYYIFNK